MRSNRRVPSPRPLLSESEPSPRVSGAALTGLRVLVGLEWLYNVAWKTPPDFGRDSGGGLYGFTGAAVEHPVFPPFSWLVEHLVLPNFLVFAWLTLVVETVLAVLLLTGTLVRIAALLGIGQSLAICFSVAEAPNEWPWSYFMLIGIHVVLLCTWSTRYFAVDEVRAQAHRGSGPRAAAALLRTWGIILALLGVAAVIASFQTDRWASLGGVVGYEDLEVGLGTYNLAGALAVLVVAACALAGGTLGRRALALAAAVLAFLAAATIYIQSGRTDVWLGGTNTSAAVFLCAALVSAATGRWLGHSRLGQTTAKLTGRARY
ncbi:Rv1678 family membrane protein [Rhodococcus sp. MSC1_016]|uniref:Rv1678 family membrane protein n=1 Tax=Rhodococcus sp. MSC1_016 TaxID=2909266 RepID=UPI0035B3BFC7